MDKIINRKREMCILFIINLLGISSIIRANFSYVDDLTRVAFGVHGWEDFGRYISNVLSTLIHGGIYLTDISPLPQIIAIVIIVIAEIILIVLFGNENNMMWNIIAVIPVGLSPYFLECLSFKYDSPYMALSVLFSVIPFLYFKRETKLYFGISFVCLLAMCMTYQAASGIYPMVVLFLFYKEWNKGQQIKKEIKFLLISILAYFASLLSYFLFVVQNTKGYVDNTSIPHISVFFKNCIKNYYHYYSNVWHDFKKTWIVFLILIGIGFILSAIKESEHKKWQAFFGGSCIAILCVLLAFGVYPMLSAPIFGPRAMFGFGILISLMALYLMRTERLLICKFSCASLGWFFFVFTFTYGNALAEQGRYTDFRIEMVINDLNDLEVINTNEQIIMQLDGNIGKSPIVENMCKENYVLNRLVPDTFASLGGWTETYFYNYFDLKNIVQNKGWKKSNLDLREMDLPILDDNMYHSIRGRDNYILIKLK